MDPECSLPHSQHPATCPCPDPDQSRPCLISGVPRNFVWGRGGSTNSVEDRGQREWGSVGGSPLVRGSGGSCNLVQEISFHIVKSS